MSEPRPPGDPYREGERVEVYDALHSAWRVCDVLADQPWDAFGVLVKVERIARPVSVDPGLLRRVRYTASGDFVPKKESD